MFVTILLIFLILFSVVLTYYLYQREQFDIAIEVFTLISGLYIGGKMSRDEYIQKREQAYNNLSPLQKHWFNRKKKKGS